MQCLSAFTDRSLFILLVLRGSPLFSALIAALSIPRPGPLLHHVPRTAIVTYKRCVWHQEPCQIPHKARSTRRTCVRLLSRLGESPQCQIFPEPSDTVNLSHEALPAQEAVIRSGKSVQSRMTQPIV
ncbi:hypothetical protein IWZ03DRAFT_39655 [Phyllosticta citriasiana]|uniref:Secreted protein n=1 Tax=Phyllosticta citriasiana TaxID=595635 RepID=A0ABR1KFY4_9PEZI